MATMIMKRFGVPTLLLALVFGLVGCQSIINKAKDVATKAAINAADKQVHKLYDDKIQPKIDSLEDQIGELDQDGDGEFSGEELTAAIMAKIKTDIAEGGLGGIDWSTILMLIGMWIAQKLGFKFGPRGFRGFRNWKSKRAREPEVDLG